MDEEPSEDNEDGTWFLVAQKRKRQAQAMSNLPCNTELTQHSQEQVTSRKSFMLPPLPIDDLTVVFRPRDGLNLSEWPQDFISRAIGMAAQLPDITLHQLTIRIRQDQNVAVVSTPDEEIAARLQKIKVLCLSNKQYEVQAYVAAPDASCKGVISGIEKNTTPTTLMTNLRSPTAPILHARMMGTSATAIITFSGTRLPRYIYYYGAEYRCYIHKPRQQLCGVCLSTTHRADVCPTPDKPRCTVCGIPSPTDNHVCAPKCFNCGGEHPATDSRCPARQRKPFNKSHIHRQQKKMAAQQSEEQRKPSKATSFNLEETKTTTAPHHRSCTRSRSKRQSRSRSHSQGLDRSRSRSHSKDHKRSRGRSHSASHIHNQQQEGNQPQGVWATRLQQQGKNGALGPAGTGGKTTSAISRPLASALAIHPAPLPRPVATGMECVVEGHTISAEEWSDGSWQPSPGFRAQEKRRLELRQATPHQNAAQQATATRNDMKPRPPPQRKRGPLPRMPADTIHIVGRPKTPVDLTKLPPWQLYEALLKAASLPDQPPASRDKLRVHPTNNTFTISVPDSVRAQAYLRITSLQIGDRTIEFHVYAPPPDDAFRGIMFNAYDSFTDDEILKDLQESNPSMPVVGGRRMGRSNHVLVTMLGDCLPRWILYHGVYIRLYPFYPRVEACFNCRKVGHRTDVCPHPKRNRCSRCGQDHPSTPQEAHPIRQRAEASTQPGATTAAAVDPPQQSLTVTRASSSPLPCSPNSSQGSSPSSSTPGPKKLAWAQGPPESLKASPTSSPDAQVRELVRENSSLKAQLSSQQSQISQLMSQIGNLTQYIQSLDAKLDRTIAQPPVTAPQPMEATSPPSQPQSQPAGKRKANTSTASLHAEIDIAAAVSKAVSAALTTLDAKFEARFNTLQQAIADTNSSLNALKSYTEATNTSLNTLKNYTEATTAEINARLERRQRGPQTRNGLIMARPTLTVWQWNCRGYRKKRSHLQQLVQKLQADPQATEPAPDVIALQETSTPSTLPGYAAYHQLGSHASPCTSTLVHNGLTAVQHDIEATGIQHALVEILPRKRTDSKKPKPTARITEWPKFRKLREERASDTITDINEWITSLQEHVQATTREVETTADLHTTDSRLLHMWDAHAGLLRRWRRQRHNKKLRRRLETLAREIENHSLALAQQQWGQLCDGLNGQMSSKRTWHLLRQLLDPCSSKLSAQKQLQRLLHRYPGTDAELLDELALRYVSLASPDAPPEKLPPPG
ncbi:hypothetical protein HPB52_012589 [Rhipicephalus sanguineus]|uniref:CCHC-type domain-containing protein n=1 Tax=Rhipicephalus sanguineus TaxID=34632 RepID=A0A9D4QB78_RHISA|nr:hypothetical protein HPB52_012589 [Rhipicephalus sanguineus]